MHTLFTKMPFIGFAIFFSFWNGEIVAQHDSLRNKLIEIAGAAQGEVGIAIMNLENGDTLTIQGAKHFSMQSVYKFHLALTVLDQVDKGKFTLDQKIKISKKDLLPHVWSPLRDKYPMGDIDITIGELLQYTVSKSDNNGCDILFRLIGGTQVVQNYIHGLGVTGNAIVNTEEEMHKDWNAQFRNWSTPLAAVQLLDIFYHQKNLTKSSRDFLWKILLETDTGPKRLKGLLPTQTKVAHKTGSSGTDDKGVTVATNDIGIVELPSGKHYSIAVFVSNSPALDDKRDEVIAKISRATWDYFLRSDTK